MDDTTEELLSKAEELLEAYRGDPVREHLEDAVFTLEVIIREMIIEPLPQEEVLEEEELFEED